VVWVLPLFHLGLSTSTHATRGAKATVTVPVTCTYHGVSCTQSHRLLGAGLSLISLAPHYRMDNLHKRNQLPSLLQQSPIWLLPSELLREIFSRLASQGLFQLRHALFVCRRWYNIIVSHKTLWSTIIINEEIVDRLQLYSIPPDFSRVGAYIRACLDRSAPLPLDFTLSAPFEDPFGAHYCSVLDELLNSGEPRHIQRCRYISWYIGYTYDGDIPVVATLLPPSLERLEYLFLKGFAFENRSLIRFPQCPRLKEVHLFNYFDGVSPEYFLNRDHTHVEKLTYTSDAGWIDHDIPYIQWFHAIRTLVLEDAAPYHQYEAYEEPENTSIAHLHSLETLKLIGSIPLEIMQRLHAPILRRVEIAAGNSVPQSHALDAVPLVLLESVTEMGISIYLSDDETPPDPQHLRRVICGAPSLTSIFGTFRIGELLAGEGWFRERHVVYHCL